MQGTVVIGTAKRDIKEGEVLTLTLRPDGFCDSADIKIRKGLAFLDLGQLKPQTKENGNGTGNSCSIWK